MSDLNVDWPWGPGATELTQSPLPACLTSPMTIMAGTADTKITGKFFPKGPKSLKQGPHRYARAHTYLTTARRAAAEHNVALAWQVIDVADVGHDGRLMSAAAAPVIFDTLRAAP